MILVVAIALAASCVGGRKGTRGGTNVGSGSDEGGPWTQGQTPAAMPQKR